MKYVDVKKIVEWVRAQDVALADAMADSIEEEFLPKADAKPGAQHSMEDDACYAFTCGACGKHWVETWGEVQDPMSVPIAGDEVSCEHCGTKLGLAPW